MSFIPFLEEKQWLAIGSAFLAPVVVGGLYAAVGGTNAGLLIRRGELLVVIPMLTILLSDVIISYWLRWRPRQPIPTVSIGSLGTWLIVLLITWSLGALIGLGIDVSLLIKWRSQ